jgi:hypothetical protein
MSNAARIRLMLARGLDLVTCRIRRTARSIRERFAARAS